MPKAIFIMDMPETCGKCKFIKSEYHVHNTCMGVDE